MFNIILFLFDMIFSTFLTIPLYRIICNISYNVDYNFFMNYSYFYYLTDVSYLLSNISNIFINMFDILLNKYDTNNSLNILFKQLYSISYITITDMHIFYNITSDTDIIELILLTKNSNLGLIEFFSLQNKIFMYVGESTLCFFRLYNPTFFDVSCFFIYIIFPEYFIIYVNKLQCFCFELIYISKFESLDLPVLLYISKEIYNNTDTIIYNKLYLCYILFLTN